MSRSRKLLAIVILGGLLAAGVAFWFLNPLNRLVAAAIRSVGSEVTGVRVGVESVDISAADGNGVLRGLSVGNPGGFTTPYAARVEEVNIAIDLATIASEVIVIRSVNVVRPDIIYEYAPGGSNLDVIQRQVAAPAATGKGSARKEQGPRLIVEDLVIRGATARVSAAGLGGRTLTVPVADLRLRHIGRARGGATPEEVARVVSAALTHNVAAAATPVPGGVGKGADSLRETLQGLFK